MPLFKDKWYVSDELVDELRSRFLRDVDSSPEGELFSVCKQKYFIVIVLQFVLFLPVNRTGQLFKCLKGNASMRNK